MKNCSKPENTNTVVKDQHEFRCCICDAPVPEPTDLLTRVQAIATGIMCEDCDMADYVFGRPEPTYLPAGACC